MPSLQLLLLLILVSLTSAGCEIAEGIFKMGAWMGAIAVILVLAIIGAITTKIRG